ncbi:MAG: DinB family protein [Chloroflexota bacterium]|nr:DinB family protein [Dehalococcoidia bacterium]MDW8253709.1 DinB family protein [Chloroflexota bacterium]
MSDLVPVVRELLQTTSRMLIDATSDLTVDQVNWLPPGTANTIGHTYAHIVNIQDRYLNTFILGQPTIWEREGWGERLGLPETMRMSREAAAQMRLDPSSFRAYAERVFAETMTYLERVDAAELAREVQGYRGPITVAEVIGRMMPFHAISHLGEVAVLRGLQGLKGLPF